MDNRKNSPLDAEYTSGGLFYAKKSSTHKQLRKKILEMKAQGLTRKLKMS